MRSAIYVYEATTLTIKASEDGLELEPLDRSQAPVALTRWTQLPLRSGIYRVMSTAAIEVSGPYIDTALNLADTDDWPDPPGRVTASFAITEERLREFFAAKQTP